MPALNQLTAWLRDQRPETAGTAIVHGGFRLRNVMFADAAPVRLAAIFDWEVATLGDVGYLCAMWAQAGDPEALLKLTRATSEPGYPTRQNLAVGSGARSARIGGTRHWRSRSSA